MSIFDFFRKKHKEPELKKIALKDIDSEIESELKIIKSRIQNIQEQVKENVFQLISKLKMHIPNLKNINLEERKAHEKIKTISEENLNFYIFCLQKLTEQLESLDFMDTNYLGKINSLFSSFQITSANSFEKATILIGRELKDVKDSMKTFSKNFDSILAEGKEIFEKESQANKLNEIAFEIKQKENAKIQVENILKNFRYELQKLNEKKKDKEKELENLKNSNDYKKALEEKEKTKQKIEELQKEIFGLKQELNLKELSKHFHSDRKKSHLISNYIENFAEALEKDKNLEIIDVIKEIKPDFNAERLEEIQLKNNELKIKEFPIEEQLIGKEEEFGRMDFEISSMLNEIEREKKKKERILEKENEARLAIKNYAKILWGNIEVID